MARYSKGFSLIEVLCVIALMLFGFFMGLPSFRQWLSLQNCNFFISQLQTDLRWMTLQANILNQDLLMVTDSMPMHIKIKVSNQVLKSIENSYLLSYHWHSQQALLFHANPIKNHVNGFFEIQCPYNKPIKLWVNRLGHMRVER